MSEGMSVGGNSHVSFQPPIDKGGVQSSEQVGKLSTGISVKSVDVKNTKGLIRTDGNAKHEFKHSPVRALANRVIQKAHQLGKNWVSASDSQLRMLDHIKDPDVSSEAKSVAKLHNTLVDEIESLEQDVALLEAKVSSFKEEYGAAIKLRNKDHLSSSDFKIGKSLVIPKSGEGSERITITSDVKSARKEQIEDIRNMLKNDPDIKARFSEHNQNKHDIKASKQLIAEKKEELYKAQKQTRSALSKAADQLYKEQKAEFKETRESTREGVKKSYESHRNSRKSDYQAAKQELGADYRNKHNEKVEVRKEKSANKKQIKQLNKQIKSTESRVGNLMAKVAKKLMPKAQREAVFRNSGSVKEAMNRKNASLIVERDELKETRRGLKTKVADLKKQQKEIKSERLDHKNKLKGANKLKSMAKSVFKKDIKVGGELGDLKSQKKKALDQIKKDYKASKVDAKKARKQNKKDLKDLANGKLKESTNARKPMEMRPVLQFLGDRILDKFSNDAFKQDQEWKSEISLLVERGEPKDVDLVEKKLSLWTVDPENSGDYTEVIEFIHNQKKSL